jgi:type I restriction-modification system DNA methylase subunit/predicted type IV restriction endonuclease
MTKEQAYNIIAKLIYRFHEHVEEYTRNLYNEHQTRVDFINPFFKALGWDIDNEQGFAEAYREVIHEDKVKIGGATKAPDYGFTLFGQRKFFVDAKKPSINIKGDIAPAYQVRRYGWSAKVPISIVTDFEEFSIYDCTKKPKTTDKASVSRIKYLTYDQYLDEFDFIWDVFAKENLPKGHFDKYVQSDTGKKGTATVDKEFLKSIEEWRRYLASTIALRNNSIIENEINYAVQKTIDRIIFLRICEDRGVEPYGELKKTAKKGDIYQNLFRLYRIADDKYNSGLFDFKEDNITPNLNIDDKVLKTIITELYYPNCQYEFSVMPADILGSVYERFLGKTIRLTKGHNAKIEEKPEVRKAGGVYYTPKNVVDYIVLNTIGKLIEGKTPKQVEKFRICDPACGSGSFLIGAYHHLIDWHLQYYTDNPPGNKKDSPLTPYGKLTTAEKKRILLNNIFGVDIDAQAVEVTKLNLLLKALEGETQASINQQMQLFHERILPNLNQNIKCGNSLISSDFFNNQLTLFTEHIKKINSFDWEEDFPEIFREGGFDVVIGNPPYIQSREGQLSEAEKEYYYKKYSTTEYQINTYGLFLECGAKLLKKRGLLGFIIPNYWLSTKYDKKLRKHLFQQNRVTELVNIYKVFESATVDTLILLLTKEKSTGSRATAIKSISRKLKSIQERLDHIAQRTWSYFNEVTIDQNQDDIQITFTDKFVLNTDALLGDYFDFKFGAKLYEVGKGMPPQTREFSKVKKYESSIRIDKSYKPLIRARHVKRYCLTWADDWVKYGDNLAAPRDVKIYQGDRILLKRIISKDKIDATFLDTEKICTTDVITLLPKIKGVNVKFFLGIICSRLCASYIKSKNVNLDRAAFPKINTNTMSSFPIPNLSSIDKVTRATIIKFVDNLLMLNQQLQTMKLETQRQQIQRTINHSERKIDELVYGLYGMREDEIEIIETL